MLERKNKIKGSKLGILNGDTSNEILKYHINYGLEFSDLDIKSKDKLIKEICKSLLKLTQDKKD